MLNSEHAIGPPQGAGGAFIYQACL